MLFILNLMSVIVLSQNNVGYFRRFYIDDRQYQLRTLDKVDQSIVAKTYCYKVSYDDSMRIAEVEYLRLNKPEIDQNGFAAMKVYYSKSFEKREFLNPAKRPMKNRKGVYSIILSLNDNKVPISLTNYDNNGVITKDKNGVAEYEWKLDDKNWKIESIYKDVAGNRISDNDSCWFEIYRWNEDKDGFLPEISYYGKDGKLNDGKRNYSTIKMRFDKISENLLEIRYLNSKSCLTLNSDSFAIARLEYNKKGNLKMRYFFDQNEQPTNSFNGFCRIKYSFNRYGNVTITQGFAKNSGNNFIEQRFLYDDLERIIEKSTWMNGKKLIANQSGFAIIKFKYDTKNEPDEIWFYNVANKLIDYKKVNRNDNMKKLD